MKIGILSDTHGYFDDSLRNFFEGVDELWHAGDIGGGNDVVEAMEEFKLLRAVFGNIDGEYVRRKFPRFQRFYCEGVDVLMTHIGGYPGKYEPSIIETLYKNPPQLFICGHSHILKVMYDKKMNFLHINPGAAGKYGFHKVRTAIRLEITDGEMKNLEIGEWAK